MIKMVTFEKTLYNDLPYKFEAGTPYIAGVIGLGEVIDYINSIGIDRMKRIMNMSCCSTQPKRRLSSPA